MAARPRAEKWLRRAFLFLTVSIAVYALLSFAATAIVRDQLTKAVNGSGARIIGTPGIETSLFSGSLDLHDLLLEPATTGQPARFTIAGHIDTLRISGLSLWSLLRGRVRAENLLLRTRGLNIWVSTDTVLKRTIPDEDGPDSFGISELDVRLRSTVLRKFAKDTSCVFVNGLTYKGAGASLHKNAEGAWLVHLPGNRSVNIDSLHADMGGEQHFDLGRLRLDQAGGSCDISRASFGADTSLATYAAMQDVERDVASGSFPRITFRGVRIPEHLEENGWSARSIHVDSGNVRIFRDKTRPDGPETYMPLPSRLVRMFPPGAGVDSLVLYNSDIVYNERATYERGFGQVPFRRMNALATGVRNMREDSAMLTVRATCIAFERAPVDFTFTARVQDTTDHFDVVARIGSMPFRDLNVAFGPLADMQAMSGTLDTVVMRLSADDRLSRGKVRLAYHDLRMVQGDEATQGARTKPLSVLMNALIPNDKAEGDLAVTDEVYTLSRRRDRSMFNYLWINLREGSKKVVLPGFLEKR